MRFTNRREAGRRLATLLSPYANRPDVIVLGLPRGGVPVAAEIAQALGAPLDVFLVRKIGAPHHPELAIGAVAEGDVQVLDRSLIAHLRIPETSVHEISRRERAELDRRQARYRPGRPAPQLRGRTVIVVDDGLATGATMEAAIRAVRQLSPARIVAAAPVGAPETCDRLGRLADEVVCVERPAHLEAVGLWYDDFSQTTDQEVLTLLNRASLGQESAAVPPDSAQRTSG
jgi:predicted phosphoribosyltransferase